MTYLRFLADKDYCSIATEEHMRQLIRDVPDRIPQAEQRAEMQMLEYLDQYYEIEKVLAVGKGIRDYSVNVTYPGNVFIRHEGEIFKTVAPVNGLKKPTLVEYWRRAVNWLDLNEMDNAKRYSQKETYMKGQVVKFGTDYWVCLVTHGYEMGEVHMPGDIVWTEVKHLEWEPNLQWEANDVCSFNGKFYQYLGGEDVEEVMTPEDDDRWGLIGDYDENLEYAYSEDSHDYVVAEGTVFRAIMDPNPGKLEAGVNIVREDPRNANVVAHMARIALYHLHSIISPTNISETRRWAYEDSMQWLYNASKFKINPQIPRKTEKESGLSKVDWACATFQRDYDPNENAWLI